MNRRQFLLYLTSISSSWLFYGSLAFADDDETSSDDDDHDDHDDEGDKDESDNSGSISGHDDHGDSEGDHSESERERDNDDHENALRAVQSNEIVPLRDVKRQFERQIDGKIIDIKFINTLFQKQYKFTYIDRQNRVRNAYFDAKSGAFVR